MRLVRATTTSGVEIIINVDNVTEVIPGEPGHLTVYFNTFDDGAQVSDVIKGTIDSFYDAALITGIVEEF